jgi:hypothetical protein
MWPFNRKSTARRKRRRTRDVWKPGTKVVAWSKKDSLTLESAYKGIFIAGATGSAKTTASGAAIAESLLSMNCGALVLTAKANEVSRWVKYCRRLGRSRDVVIFRPGEGFNYIDYERDRGTGGGDVENLVNLFSVGCEIADSAQSRKSSGREEGEYWKNTRLQLCRHAVVLLTLGHESVGPNELYELVMSAPRSLEEKDSPEWRANSFCAQCLLQADERCKTIEERADLELAAKYFLREFATLDNKTRSNIVSTLTSMIDVLLRGLAKGMLCGETTVTPECLEEGKIVIMGVPLFDYGLPGALIQGIVKYSFQRALLRRDIRRSPRPVLIFADEFQCFLNSFDQEFLATCRESRVINVCLTQNIPNLYAVLGGEQRGKSQVDSLLGNLNLKIMHANGDPTTNEWAANSIGHSRQYVFSANTSHDSQNWWPGGMGYGMGPQISAGMTEAQLLAVQPSEFTQLRSGGRRNGWKADAIVFQAGEIFSDTATTWRRTTFRQRL